MSQSAQAMKKELLRDFNAVVEDAEQLLKAMANEGGDKANSLRARTEQNLRLAKARLNDLEDSVLEKTKMAARATDEYVHENPWRTIGVATGIGIAIGLLLNRR